MIPRTQIAVVVLALGASVWWREATAQERASAWAESNGVPSSAAAADPRDAGLLASCGVGDSRLHAAAAQVAATAVRGGGAPDMHELTTLLHRLGDPHVRARAWTLRSRAVDRGAALDRLRAWVSGINSVGTRRCGVASIQDSEQGEAVAVVAIDAVADLVHSIPTQVRAGSWITFEATSLVSVGHAKVVILGPRGAPRTVPTSYDPSSRRVFARFMVDTPGHWSAQLLTSTAAGPLPSLEVELFAQVKPETGVLQAPGEPEGAGVQDEAVALTVMLNATRRSEGLPTLVRDVRLDAIAAQHVAAMMKRGLLAHEAGDGSPWARVDQEGIAFREIGENVVHAPSAAVAHRVLWASPSHRGNMLHSRFRRVGVAAGRDRAGALWATQLFAGEGIPDQSAY